MSPIDPSAGVFVDGGRRAEPRFPGRVCMPGTWGLPVSTLNGLNAAAQPVFEKHHLQEPIITQATT